MREPAEHPYCPTLQRNLRLLSERRARQSREIEDARRQVADRERDLEKLKSEPVKLTDLLGFRGSRGRGRRRRDQDEDEHNRQRREEAERAEETAELVREAENARRQKISEAQGRLRAAERNLAQAESRYDDTDRALSMNVQRYKTYGCQDNILNFIRM